DAGSTTVDAVGGHYTSLKLGANGLARVGHTRSSNDRDLFFTQNTSGNTWASGTVRSIGANAIQYVSLAVDVNDANHLAWYESNGGGLNYAFCSTACTTPANWTRLLLKAGANAGQYPSVAADSAGHPRISFFD